MIQKLEEKKNGYRLTETSVNDELREIQENHKPFKRILCNRKTARRFTGCAITVDNRIADETFYINQMR